MSGRTTLPDAFTRSLLETLETDAGPRRARRQPIHVVYGGAHIFSAETIPKLGRIARKFYETYAPRAADLATIFEIDQTLADKVHSLITAKLSSEPVEDFRVDFEDGYGPRSDAEEDAHAVDAARETARAIKEKTLPAFFGIRIKTLSPQTGSRALRTLDLYLTSVGELPSEFVVTLPKVDTPQQVSALSAALEELEARLHFEKESIGIELMIETPQSVVSRDGRIALPALIEAGGARVRSVHYGAYDYTAACGMTAAYQEMSHGASDFVRHVMQVSLADTDVAVVDGATNILPIPPHRGDSLTDEQQIMNREVVTGAWKVHYDLCRRSLANGFYQSWDLHPAQIPARLAAVYSFFLEQMDDAATRLQNFLDAAAQATTVGDRFDDAATGQGLLNFFVRAVDCGALSENEAAERTGIAVDSLRSGLFARIVAERQ
jgi:citrate lyase beta subunit